jgi:hypothetical protein
VLTGAAAHIERAVAGMKSDGGALGVTE